MQTSFSKTAALTAILSAPLALLSLVLIFGAFNWDFDVAFDPAKAIAYQPNPSTMLRYGWLLDILGYYVLLVPLAIYLQHWLSAKAPLHSQLFTFCGLGYIICGGLGAAIMAGTSEPSFSAYQTGDATQQIAVAAAFANTFHEVFDGIWNQFSMLLGAIWLLGMGWLLRSERRGLAWMTSLIGIASLVDFLGMVLQMELVSTLGLNVYLWFWPIWALWLGLEVWRHKEELA